MNSSSLIIVAPLLFCRICSSGFHQAVARASIQVETIEFLQFLDALQALLAKWTLPIEGVQDDSLQEIAEGQIVIVGEGTQHLQKAFFHADAGLDPFNRMEIGRSWHSCYLGTSLPR